MREDPSPDRTSTERHPPEDYPRDDRAKALCASFLKVNATVGEDHDPDRPIANCRSQTLENEGAEEKLERDKLKTISEFPDEEIGPAPPRETIEWIDQLKVWPKRSPERDEEHRGDQGEVDWEVRAEAFKTEIIVDIAR